MESWQNPWIQNRCRADITGNENMFGFGNTFQVEFIGGSRDGDVIPAKGAPDFLKFKSGNRWIEVYERQNEVPPFIYIQIGYAEEEQWK